MSMFFENPMFLIALIFMVGMAGMIILFIKVFSKVETPMPIRKILSKFGIYKIGVIVIEKRSGENNQGIFLRQDQARRKVMKDGSQVFELVNHGRINPPPRAAMTANGWYMLISKEPNDFRPVSFEWADAKTLDLDQVNFMNAIRREAASIFQPEQSLLKTLGIPIVVIAVMGIMVMLIAYTSMGQVTEQMKVNEGIAGNMKVFSENFRIASEVLAGSGVTPSGPINQTFQY